MSKNVVKLSLQEMYIVKHSVGEAINRKKEKLKKTKDANKIANLEKDIAKETKFYDKMTKTIENYKKKNDIPSRESKYYVINEQGRYRLIHNEEIIKELDKQSDLAVGKNIIVFGRPFVYYLVVEKIEGNSIYFKYNF